MLLCVLCAARRPQGDLVSFCVEGDKAGVAAALAQTDPPLDVNETTAQGRTPLFGAFKMLLDVETAQADLLANRKTMKRAGAAAQARNAELREDLEAVVCLLVFKGADPALVEASSELSPNWSLMHYCAQAGNAKRARQLLKLGCAADVQDAHGRTPLHEAARCGELAVADALVRVGCPLDARDHNGWAPLHHAAAMGRTHLCKQLLIAGASKIARNRELHSPADLAMARGHQRTGQTISTFYKESAGVKRLLTELEGDYHDGGRT